MLWERGSKMGNPDLIIIINGIAFLIKGVDYDTQNEAVLKIIKKFEENWEKVRAIARPEELIKGFENIKEIKVYELNELNI